MSTTGTVSMDLVCFWCILYNTEALYEDVSYVKGAYHTRERRTESADPLRRHCQAAEK
jgi:hypothetical protein